VKKSAKKLTLHRETVLRLGASELGRIAGGTPNTSLACIEYTGCDCDPDTNACYPYTACFGTCSCAGTYNRTC
jgi:hypothetical protein